jgi:putative phosphoesterase
MSIAADENSSFGRAESYCQFGCDTLSKLLKGLETQIDGAIVSKDVECVHKIRVSSRKLRTVLPLFQSCCPKKQYKHWFKEIKAIAILLSEARDLDVQIIFIQKYIKESPTERQCLMPLLKNHKNKRKTIQTTLTKGLANLQKSDVLTEISNFLKQQNSSNTSNNSFNSLSIIEKACWNIIYEIDTFLSQSEYVHQESAILRHHDMRINAKQLRYTMETFASLYPNELTQEIQLIKNFQDLLGEMHDCDIWQEKLSPFIITQPKNSNQTQQINKNLRTDAFKKTVIVFSMYITEYKTRNYNHFVQLWEKTMAQNFFDNIKKTVNDVADFKEKQLSKLLKNYNIKIAVLSDIHANLHALEAVLEDAEKRGAQLFLNAGDSIGFGASPNEVLHLLYERNVINVCGNFDSEFFKNSYKCNNTKKLVLSYAKKELTKLCKAYLNSFDTEIKLKFASKKVFMTHASPLSPTEYLTPYTSTQRLKKIVDHANADLIIVGHSHEQFHHQLDNGVSLLNPGSVGQPSDGNPQTAYAMLSFNPLKVDLIRLNYPVAAAVEALRKKRLPESFAQMLLRGVPLDTIISEDKAKKQDVYRNWSEITKIAQDLSQVYLQDKAHLEQVRKLALNLFDALQSLHHLGDYERGLLECAVLLHDLGLSQDVKGHNKISMQMILNELSLPLTLEEHQIIASITRYHRGGLPKQKHYNLAFLNNKSVNIVSALSGILRIADAFDYFHNSDFKLLSIKTDPKKVMFECSSNSNTSLIAQAFDKKKNLFENFFKRKVMLTWLKQSHL